MTLTIRKLMMDDLPEVVAIDQASFSLPWPARSFQFELTDNPASRCWVAELEKRVVGIVVAWLIVDEIHIATIATHPDYRQQGIGSMLLLHTLHAAKEEGALSSFLEVRESNVAALEMYHNFGYIKGGRREGYYKDNNEAAILMTLEHLPGDE